MNQQPNNEPQDTAACDACTECGAPVLPGRTCRDHFHALLAYEWEIPGGPGEVPHFYAVATYGLQHPASMGFTVETASALRDSVARVLEGAATMEETRRRTRDAAHDRGRISRRDDDRVPKWPIESWPVVITDVLPGEHEGYAERVERWARSVIATVNGLEP